MTVLTQPSEWSRRLAQALVSGGYCDQPSADSILASSGSSVGTFVQSIARSGLVQSQVAMELLSKLSGISLVDLTVERPSVEAIKALPADLANEFKLIGYQLGNGRLTVVGSEPLDNSVRNTLSNSLGLEINIVLSDPEMVERVMKVAYNSDPSGAAPPPMPAPPMPVIPGQAPPPMPAMPTQAPPPPPMPAPPMPVIPGQAPPPMPAMPSQATPLPPMPAPPMPAMPTQAPPPPPMPAPAPMPDVPTKPKVPVMHDINDLLVYAVEHGSSDLHLTNRIAPCIRVDGSIRPIEGQPPLDNETIREMIFSVITQGLREKFEANKELDTSHSIMGVGRFRVNVFQQRGSIGAVLRTIPHEIPSFESLGLPDSIRAFTELRRGLVLVTGPTGSGKSTTLASIVSIINQTRPLHIVTVEDPIEFLHNHGRSIVNQREVGADTKSFSEALKHVLRQDPDVILVGEMRDLETISTALTAAETGHLVFATLHTQDAPQTVDRIIDVFPTNQQDQVRVQLAGSLEGIVTQQLVVSASGVGRVAVAEVLVATPAIRNLIRSAKTHQIASLMQTGAALGMQTTDQALAKAVKAGLITEAVAYDRCKDESELKDYLRSASV